LRVQIDIATHIPDVFVFVFVRHLNMLAPGLQEHMNASGAAPLPPVALCWLDITDSQSKARAN
jgi:hypothetical protein